MVTIRVEMECNMEKRSCLW